MNDDLHWMQAAIEQAKLAGAADEVPVGAVIVLDNHIIGKGFNQSISHPDPCAHAEILALKDAAQSQQNYRLGDATLYVTLEPCMMCAGAMVHARIARCVYGAYDPKTGVAESVAQLYDQAFLNHRVVVQGGVMAEECGQLLSKFFKARR